MIPHTPTRNWEAQVYDFFERDVPASIRSEGTKLVANVIAAAVAGSEAPGVREATAAKFGPGPALILGTNRRCNAAQAALVNGSSAISQEIEEGHNTGGHTGATLVMGGLALAEQHSVSGTAFVDACVKAYEICARMEEAIFAMKAQINDEVPWLIRDPHATWTVVGPTLAGLLAIDSDYETIVDGFRAAANTAVVSMFDPYAEGAPVRNFTAGHSTATGVNVALAAQAGVTGSVAALEAVYDPFEDLLNDGFTALFATLGEHWYVTENYYKTTPSCRYTHPPLDALAELNPRPNPDAIDRVDVDTYQNAVDMANRSPTTFTGGKFSIPYILARYLIDGTVTLADFEPDRLDESRVKQLAKRVHVHRDNSFETAFPDSWGARVTVTDTDGNSRMSERAFPVGDYRDPIADDSFRDLLETLLIHGLSGDIEQTTDLLLNLPDRDLGAITTALSDAA